MHIFFVRIRRFLLTWVRLIFYACFIQIFTQIKHYPNYIDKRLRTANISLFAHDFEQTKHKISIVFKVNKNRRTRP